MITTLHNKCSSLLSKINDIKTTSEVNIIKRNNPNHLISWYIGKETYKFPLFYLLAYKSSRIFNLIFSYSKSHNYLPPSTIFIAYSAEYFNEILDFFITGRIHISNWNDNQRLRFLKDAQYFDIQPLCDKIANYRNTRTVTGFECEKYDKVNGDFDIITEWGVNSIERGIVVWSKDIVFWIEEETFVDKFFIGGLANAGHHLIPVNEDIKLFYMKNGEWVFLMSFKMNSYMIRQINIPRVIAERFKFVKESAFGIGYIAFGLFNG